MDILIIRLVTSTTIKAFLGDGEQPGVGYTLDLYDSEKTTVLQSEVTDSNGEVTFTGLTPGTSYYVYYEEAGYEKATTLADPAKTATESQWQDLANRVKAKQKETTITDNTLYL